jgi:hypothetical protein
MLAALDEESATRAVVTGRHLAQALDDLLDATQAVTRTLLGVGVNPGDIGMDSTGPLPSRLPSPIVYRGQGVGWVATRRRP